MLWSTQHRGDFLTTWRPKIFEYPIAPPAQRKKFLLEVKERCYTRVGFSFFPEFFLNPEKLVPFLKEVIAAGLGPSLEMGPEGAGHKAFRQQYPPAKYAAQLGKFIKVVRPYVADYILGVEADEYWTDDDISKIGAALRKGLGPVQAAVWVHFTNGWHGEWSWWKKQPWATGLCFFYNTGVQQGKFLISKDEIVEATQVYSQRLKTAGGGKKFLAGEYCYRYPEAKAIELGKLALANGAVGFMNGGLKVD